MQLIDFSPQPAKESQQLATASVHTLLGWQITESTGLASAKVILRDGTSNAGPELIVITLTKSESTRDFPPTGIPVSSGSIYAEKVEGEYEGGILCG